LAELLIGESFIASQNDFANSLVVCHRRAAKYDEKYQSDEKACAYHLNIKIRVGLMRWR